MIEQLCCKKVILKSDSEPAILTLRDAIRKESDVEIALEETPAGDHATNGLVLKIRRRMSRASSEYLRKH